MIPMIALKMSSRSRKHSTRPCGSAVTNRAPVTVTLGQVDYPMSAWELALGAFLVGAVLASIVAIVEGAAIRLDNHRLRREIHKMETELNFLRTQPSRPAPAG